MKKNIKNKLDITKRKKTEFLTLAIEKDDLILLNSLAKTHKTTRSEVVRAIIKDYLNK